MKIKQILVLILIVQLFACKHQSKEPNAISDVKLDNLTDTWKLASDENGILWDVKTHHTDHLEFSGLFVSGIISYGNDSLGNLVLHKKIVWPMLRTIPNDTHGSLIHDFAKSINPMISIDGVFINEEKPYEISFDGILKIKSKTKMGIEIERNLFPSTNKPAIIEQITILNKSEDDLNINIDRLDYLIKTDKKSGVYGEYKIRAYTNGYGSIVLKAGESYSFSQIYSANKNNEEVIIDASKEHQKRENFISSINSSLVFDSPNKNMNQMFRFAKLRAAESIFKTKGGLMHGPGGGRYYAAIWANDQAEYVNPFFPFLGNENGNESAINSFRNFARFMNPDFQPIPSSIVAEGIDIWNGAGDRGDAAMIAYGASRFALAYGNKETADTLLPLIKWCLDYCERKMLPEGVIASDCDELEFRFPAGKANLTTNMLAYGGYLSAANLLNSLEIETDLALKYKEKAKGLRLACENYFGANVQGFSTYRYFDGNTKLRSWICIPLTMGVFDRRDETLKALLSDKLWNKNGIFTEAGDSTFWDRATLYAFRGILNAGEVDLGMKYFNYYTQKRLLGEHVPYAVEAYPEGNQRHLSAESGLYCRVITEGLFGIEPIGLNKFKCLPRLPQEWDYMKLKNIKAFQTSFNIEVLRKGNKFNVLIINNGKIIFDNLWDGESEIIVDL